MQKDNTTYSLLIIEDNPGDALLIREYLSEYIQLPESEVATSFREARECLQSGKKEFDLIFLDLTLQDLRGEALVTAILELSGDTPVIVLTGFGDMAFSVRSLELGVSDYMLKDDLTAFSLYKSIIYNIERKRSIRDLERSKKRYDDLFHLSPQPMCVYALSSLKFLDVNLAAIQQYGYEAPEFNSMRLTDLWTEEERPRLMKELESYQRDKPGYRTGTYKLKRKDGSVIMVEVHSNKMDYSGVDARILLANDLTERIRHTRAIEEQNTKLREIAWTQSHVVRAPLARLMGLVALSKVTPEEDFEERAFCLDEIENAARELDVIIRDIAAQAERLDT